MPNSVMILIGFIILVILMITFWIIGYQVKNRRLYLAEIENQKNDIIDEIGKATQDFHGDIIQRQPVKIVTGFPVWSRWLMGMAWIPFMGILMFNIVQSQSTTTTYRVPPTTTSVPPNTTLVTTTTTTTQMSTGITYTVGTLPSAICFDGTNVWVANGGSNNVNKLRASDGTILGTYAVGTHPLGICFDGTNIWVADSDSDNVTKLKASDGTIMGTFMVGDYPDGICFDGANIWVANNGSNDVTKLTITKQDKDIVVV
jgi:hypothetical protein